ncbi:MAG: DNA primase DnaG, partial [Candidatus Kariarchaeaceae archaeon]
LQKSGRIGRMKLEVKIDRGVTKGNLVVPSSLNKVDTAILAATLESVDRVGPCVCNISLEKIVDVRKAKRDNIQKRASEIMKKWDVETREEVKSISKTVEKQSQRGRVIIFGTDALPAGPEIYQATDIILVEGRADIINLMEMGINNTIALQGTSVPNTIKNLSKTRTITALLDGDRGGDLILKELADMGKIELVARAPYKREVEDLSYDEVLEALENKVPLADAHFVIDNESVADYLSSIERPGKSSKSIRFTGKSEKRVSKKPDHPKKDGKPRKKDDKRTSRKDDSRRDDSRKPTRGRRDHSAKSSSPQLFSGKEGKEDRRDSKRTHGRRDTRPKRREHIRISIPDAIRKVIDKTKKTFSAVLIGKSNETLTTVKTSEVYDTLVDTDGVESIIVDGVITQRLLDLADDKSVKLVAGATIGEITNKPKDLQYTTFNRI